MDFEDFRKQRNAKFLEQHTLNDDELERLIENKFKRAKFYYNAFQKKEDAVVDCD
jgi:hypothetical protein